MEDLKMPDAVPYIVHEGAMARNERLVKRLIIGIIICIILLFASNCMWLYAWQSYDTVSYDQDGAGLNNIVTGVQGDLINGTETEDKDKEEPQSGEGR